LNGSHEAVSLALRQRFAERGFRLDGLPFVPQQHPEVVERIGEA